MPSLAKRAGKDAEKRCDLVLSGELFPARLTLVLTSAVLGDDRGAAHCDHEHAAILADGLIVQVNPDDGIGSERSGGLLHLGHCDLLSAAQFPLIDAGATTDNISEASKEILENICPHHRFAGDNRKR